MIPSQTRSKESLVRLISKDPIPRVTRMNRGRLSFYGTVHKNGMAGNTLDAAPRRVSASSTLQVIGEDPSALFLSEGEAKDEHQLLPIVKVTAKKRYSLPGDSRSSSKQIETVSPLKSPLNKDAMTSSDSACCNMSVSSNTLNSKQQSPQQMTAGARRRSSRKSVNGMVIEIDFDDESEITMFENLEDYNDDIKPNLKREDSNESLEELRTRLEALEHTQRSQQLPDHDHDGWGVECMKKKFIEAMESSHSQRSSIGASLRGIPEFEQLQEALPEDEEEDDEAEAEEVSFFSRRDSHSHQTRRSTIRSSVNGLVLEYDWSLGSDTEDDIASDEEC